MNNGKTIAVRAYTDFASANFAKLLLEENGIACFLSDSNVVQLYPMFGNTSSGIRLMVFEEELECANEILEELERR